MTSSLVTISDPTSPAAEAYRRLRVNLTSGQDGQWRTLLVAAAGQEAEKAVTAANLAVAFARVGKQVILVDCDLRHPVQHTLFGLGNSSGVTTASRGTREALPLQTTEVPGLRVLTSGPAVEVPSDLVASPAMGALIQRLRDEAEVVLFDAPPVLLATDAAELAAQVDRVLVTVSAGRTKREEAQRALGLLQRVGAHIAGSALTNAPVDAQLRKYLATP